MNVFLLVGDQLNTLNSWKINHTLQGCGETSGNTNFMLCSTNVMLSMTFVIKNNEAKNNFFATTNIKIMI